MLEAMMLIIAKNTLTTLHKALIYHSVYLEGIILKMNMVNPGKFSPQKPITHKIVKATLTAFLRTVPPAIFGNYLI